MQWDFTPPLRLALAYSNARARPHWAALMQLDARFARIVAQTNEPALAQIKLAWWRETFARPIEEWPQGEPLLARLSAWGVARDTLAALADGWEAMIGERPLPAASLAALSDARAWAMVGLGRVVSSRTDRRIIQRAAYRWSLADIAIHQGDAEERSRAMALLAAADGVEGRVDKAMRPLTVIQAMAERAASATRPIGGAGDFFSAIRAGLTGR